MPAKDLIDGIRRDFPFPLTLARYRDLIARLVFDRPYSSVIAADRAGKLSPPIVQDTVLSALALEYGDRVHALADVAREHVATYRRQGPQKTAR